MKCPKCGTEVEKGSLFCPKCLEEVPWVPEYNTVETILTKKKYNKHKRSQEARKELGHRHIARKSLRNGILWGLLAVILLGVTAVKLYTDNRNNNSYAYQYNRAEESYNQKEYEQAMEYADRAITIDNSHPEAFNLLAQILENSGDHEGAIKILETALGDFTDNVEIHNSLIQMYLRGNEPDKVKELLDESSEDIRQELSQYITEIPKVNHEEGTYGQEITLQLTAAEGTRIFYTLDGSEPEGSGNLYDDELVLGEGTTELKAVAYNEYQIPSDELIRKYIINIAGPSPPSISPAEEYFEVDTAITIEVPDGCVCYYAFDQIPDSNSTQYLTPLSMPEGSHTLYAFLVAANGKKSDMTSKTYTLVY